jgi:MFS family permease
MYQVSDLRALARLRRGKGSSQARVQVSRTVVLLGITSLLTDISSEMVTAVLPLYLVFGLGLSPLQFGVIDGVYQGASALVRVAGGFVGDRWKRHKEVAMTGYGLSAVSRLAFPLIGNALGAISAIVTVDRVGKGIRTAPRDAMISLSSPPEGLATAFSVHRAMDTAGALLGPLVTFGLLVLVPGAFDTVFVVSFCFAVLGLGVLGLFVSNPPNDDAAAVVEERDRPSLRSAVGLLGRRRFALLIAVGGVLSLVTISDGFIYLALQQRIDFDEQLLPLLYVGTALVYMVLAIPVGRVADRFGRPRVFLTGYGLLLAVYLLLIAGSGGLMNLIFCIALLGAYYAATEGVLMAIASTLLPAALRGTGLGLLVTATSLARIVAAIGFGAVWTSAGSETALTVFAAGLAVALAAAALSFLRLRNETDVQPLAS